MTAAETCRANGWGVGDIIRFPKGNVIQIGYICPEYVLGRIAFETGWSDACRLNVDMAGGQKIDKQPYNDTPPKQEWFKEKRDE